MTQVFLTTASTSPWAVPANFDPGVVYATNTTQAEGNYYFIGDATNDQGLLQTWYAPYTGLVDTITIVAAKAAAPIDNLVCTITDSTGNTTLGTATVQLPATSVGINGLGQNYTYKFSPGVSVTNGTTYGFVLKRTGALDATNYWRPIGNSATGYASGSLYSWNGSAWVVFSGAGLSFDVGYHLHTVEMVGSGGNGAAGTTGTSGNGGGAGCGGNYQWFRYGGSGITAGSTTIPFFVDSGGGVSFTMWENNTLSNCYVSGSGGSASGINGGTNATGNHSGTPPITYVIPAWGWAGGAGGVSASLKGGGGGGGCAGPDATGAGAQAVGGTGGAGGNGGNYGTTGAGAGSGSTFGAGGRGMTGTPGGTSGAAGTGGSGGAGTTATTTTGSTAGAGGSTDTGFDASHGFGGGGGGAGAATSTGTYTITGGNGGNYGGAGGGCGYGRGTATFTTGKGAPGLISIFYDVVAVVGGPAPATTLAMMGVG